MAYLLFLSPSIQTYVCKEIAKDISRTTNSHVSIKSVYFSPFKSIIINDLYIEDNQKDTLIYVHKLEACIDSINFSKRKIFLNNLYLEKAYVRYIEEKKGVYNIDMFIDALSEQTPADTTTNKAWLIDVSKLEIKQSKFAYKTYLAKKQDYGMNYADILAYDLNLKIKNIKYTGDSLNYYLSEFSSKEKSGFQVNKFSGKQWITNKQWGLSDVYIQSEHSEVNASLLTFNYKQSENTWSKFITHMKIDYRVKSSTINFIDISYFNDILKGYKEIAHVSGRVYGTIDKLKGRNINIEYGDRTIIKGKFSTDGLPDIFDTYIVANIEELSTNFNDIEKIYLPHYEDNYIKIPSELKQLGVFSYSGKFNGFLNDFVCYGEIKTKAGILKTDILFKPQSKSQGLIFKGDLTAKNFFAGKLFSLKNLSSTSFNIHTEGLYKQNGTKGYISGNINQINIYNYNYKNIKLDGVFSSNLFDGMLSIKDPNIDFNFQGKVDLSSEIPTLNFSSSLKDANLYALKLNTKDKKSKLSFNIRSNFSGSGPDNANGVIDINNISYTNNIGHIDLHTFKLEAETNANHKKISLESDFMKAYIKGNYKINKLANSLQSIFNTYIPNYFTQENTPREEFKTDSINNFSYQIDIINIDSIINIIYPNISIANNSRIEGNIDTKNNEIGLKFNSAKIVIRDKEFYDIKLNIKSDNDKFVIKNTINKIKILDNYYLYNITNNLSLQNNKLTLDLLWNNWGDKTYSGYISTVTELSISDTRNKIWNLKIKPSNIIVADSVWRINESTIKIDSSSIKVNNFAIKKLNESISINGSISESISDILNINIKDLNLENLNSIIGNENLKFKGKINSTISVNDIFNHKKISSKLSLSQLVINKDTIGNLHLFTKWDEENKKLKITSILKHKNKDEIKIIGNYIPSSSEIDLQVKLNRFVLKPLELYFSDNISELEGTCSADIDITGKINKPHIEGSVIFNNSRFKINRLQTIYTCKDTINIKPELVEFNNFKLYDLHKNQADITGTVSHNNFNNIKYDLAILYNNFQILNTKDNDTDAAYGNIFISGSTHISGNTNKANIDINARTEKNSRLFISLNSNSDIVESHFINFINHNPEYKSPVKEKIKTTGYNINCDVEITPSTEIQIILNSKIGDILKAKGKGIMNFSMNTKGDFKILGEYIVKKGSYLFTLQDVINKKFKLEEGGYIKWNGDPYDADINMNAIYNLKTSINELMLNSNNIDSNRKIPVQCRMNISNKLLSPLIKFDINFPTLDQQTQSLLEGLFINEDEINKQLLYLLVLNKFYTPEYLRASDEYKSTSGGNAVGVTTSELLSNQLSNWLSHISNDFDIGINYRPGDEISTDEVELALSTQIFNNKITINGNVATGRYQSQANNIVGDADINFKLDKKGKLQIKAFTRANEYLLYEDTRNTQGVGIFYKEDFDSILELFRKYSNFIRRKNKNIDK